MLTWYCYTWAVQRMSSLNIEYTTLPNWYILICVEIKKKVVECQIVSFFCKMSIFLVACCMPWESTIHNYYCWYYRHAIGWQDCVPVTLWVNEELCQIKSNQIKCYLLLWTMGIWNTLISNAFTGKSLDRKFQIQGN